jgi:hypothetical protein
MAKKSKQGTVEGAYSSNTGVDMVRKNLDQLGESKDIYNKVTKNSERTDGFSAKITKE